MTTKLEVRLADAADSAHFILSKRFLLMIFPRVSDYSARSGRLRENIAQ